MSQMVDVRRDRNNACQGMTCAFGHLGVTVAVEAAVGTKQTSHPVLSEGVCLGTEGADEETGKPYELN